MGIFRMAEPYIKVALKRKHNSVDVVQQFPLIDVRVSRVDIDHRLRFTSEIHGNEYVVSVNKVTCNITQRLSFGGGTDALENVRTALPYKVIGQLFDRTISSSGGALRGRSEILTPSTPKITANMCLYSVRYYLYGNNILNGHRDLMVDRGMDIVLASMREAEHKVADAPYYL